MPRPTQGPRDALPVRGCHPLWPDVPVRSGSRRVATGLVRVRSPLLTESLLMSFPPVTEMFQFTGFASHAYGFSMRYRRSGGFPHSEIRGSTIARISPRLIAACYVLHRLSVPRHPPNALNRLILPSRNPARRPKPTDGSRKDTSVPLQSTPRDSCPLRRTQNVIQNLFTMSKNSRKHTAFSDQLAIGKPMAEGWRRHWWR